MLNTLHVTQHFGPEKFSGLSRNTRQIPQVAKNYKHRPTVGYLWMLRNEHLRRLHDLTGGGKVILIINQNAGQNFFSENYGLYVDNFDKVQRIFRDHELYKPLNFLYSKPRRISAENARQ